ncbi:lipoyltransferase 2, partial [Striga asiatica]
MKKIEEVIGERQVLSVVLMNSFIVWECRRSPRAIPFSNGEIIEPMRVTLKNMSSSDHNVLFLDTSREKINRNGRFIFNNGWVTIEGIEEAVESGWELQCEGTPMFK